MFPAQSCGIFKWYCLSVCAIYLCDITRAGRFARRVHEDVFNHYPEDTSAPIHECPSAQAAAALKTGL